MFKGNKLVVKVDKTVAPNNLDINKPNCAVLITLVMDNCGSHNPVNTLDFLT